MTGIVLKLKRTVGLLSMMSMLMSSVAACACSHHAAPKAESKKSCHSHSETASEQHRERAVVEYQGRIVSGPGCSCSQVSPRLVFNRDQKQSQVKTAIARSPLMDLRFVAITLELTLDNFGSESFSQSFLRNSTPGRAPPRPKFA